MAQDNQEIPARASHDVIIRTEDWAGAVRFYASFLGPAVIHQSEALASFEAGGICLYVEKGTAHGPVFEFLVPDVQPAKHRLTAAGCAVVEEDASVPRCYLRDPFGLVFNLGRSPDRGR